MTRLSAALLAPLVFAAASRAAEVTVEQRPFTIEKTFTATAMPDAGTLLLGIDPGVWADYQIVGLADHGRRVSKGEILVRFDAESIDIKLADLRRSLESGALTLAQTELDLAHLQETTPHTLESLRLAAEIAREENAYFTKTRRKADEETAAQQLERAEQMLSNQQEELRQLARMYEADDLTEETEEIILTRQKDAVARAEFALRMETLDHQRTLGVALPREAVKLADNERDSAIKLRKAEQDLPRSISLKKLELDTLRTTRRRDQETLAKLEKDRAVFEIKAPAEGWFFHGPIQNGRWTPDEALKSLFKGGRPPANRPFATFVPAASALTLVAFLDEASARSLKAELPGTASPDGREDLEFPVKLAAIAPIPGPDGKYRADLSATWPAELNPVAGTTASIRIIAHHQPAAIFLPTRALAFEPRGWTVEVKLADGKTERRPVTRGRISGDNTEILAGLEVGQVIIAPEK